MAAIVLIFGPLLTLIAIGEEKAGYEGMAVMFGLFLVGCVLVVDAVVLVVWSEVRDWRLRRRLVRQGGRAA